MSEIKATLAELASIGQEQHNMRKRAKELVARKKELEEVVLKYLEAHEKPGLRDGNIVFLATEKNSRSRKKKAEVLKATADVLRKYGVQGDINEVLKELEESKKGEVSSVSVLKMKAAGIWA